MKNTQLRSMQLPSSAVVLAFVAFIALGMPDGLLGIAWPSIRSEFAVPLDSIGYLLFAGVCGYLISSFTSGAVIARAGVGRVLTASCALTGLGLVGYTVAPSWWTMIALGVVAGLGAGAIDAGLNTYVAAHYDGRLMQWLHASYGIGVTSGPLLMTLGLSLTNSWRFGYDVVGGFQLVLALCFGLSLHLWIMHEDVNRNPNTARLTDYVTPMGVTLRQPGVWLSMLLFFLYTGAEVSAGTWAYTLLTESRDVRPEIAGFWTGSYWGLFTVGRMIAGVYATRIGVRPLVTGSLVVALTGTLLLWWNPVGTANVVSLALVGLAIAPIFPAMVSGTTQRVGIRFAGNTIGMQMAAGSLGVAVVPTAVGVIARRVTLEVVPVCLLCLFLALLGAHMLAGRLRGEGPAVAS